MIISASVLFCRDRAGPRHAKAGHVSLYTPKTRPRELRRLARAADAGVTAPGLRLETQINLHNLLVFQINHAPNTCLYCMIN
jgi:hypothetical protein